MHSPAPHPEPAAEGSRYPIGRIAFYGPDNVRTTKIVVTIAIAEDEEPVRRQWHGANVLERRRTWEEVQSFLDERGVQWVTIRPGNQGCPHEEGTDYRLGEDCPFCPYWKKERGSDLNRL
jgi:hypothetical protein